MKKRRILLKVWCGLLAIAGLFIVSCDDDGPTTPVEPQDPDYLVYYHYDADSTTYYMPRYSSRTQAPVDTIQLGSGFAPVVYFDLRFTSDGKYAIYARPYPHGDIFVVDCQSGEITAKVLQRKNRDLRLSIDNKVLCAFDNVSSVSIITIHSVPDLSVIWFDSTSVEDADFLPISGNIIYVSGTSDSFYVVDYMANPVLHNTFQAKFIFSHVTFYPRFIAVDNANGLLYTVGKTDFAKDHFLVYDTEDFSLIDTRPIPDNYSWAKPVIDPANEHVYLRASFPSPTSGEPPGILRYDVRSKVLEKYISSTDILFPPFNPQDMEITPDGKIMCVILSLGDPGKGDLAFIDVESRQILNIQYHTFGRGEFVRIFPIAR